MAPPTNLRKIGSEAFMLLDQLEERLGQRPKTVVQRRSYLNYQVFPPRDTTIDAFQAAQKYGGFMLCEHRARKAKPMLTRKAH
ncbi:hypothetical protein BVRB_8g183280 [Beta vulgaris subsp. vulgaris]|nr:hypothetical protein BVRB_8g183280 [Beta vulgaris subsp. vulgaris]